MFEVNLGISKFMVDFENNIGVCFGELKLIIIMFVGDVFLFIGVDCDEVGNVYLYVIYY